LYLFLARTGAGRDRLFKVSAALKSISESEWFVRIKPVSFLYGLQMAVAVGEQQ
jgi:hypothetical protein